MSYWEWYNFIQYEGSFVQAYDCEYGGGPIVAINEEGIKLVNSWDWENPKYGHIYDEWAWETMTFEEKGSVIEIDLPFTPVEKKVCTCGGEKANTTHSDWCDKNG
jgi:hypothetical protein